MNESLVIGVYGISGCGKSHALQQLSDAHPEWQCYEGSAVMEEVLKEENEDWATFKRMNSHQKVAIREKAAKWIRQRAHGRVVLVAGHATFPNNGADAEKDAIDRRFENVFTDEDACTYDAIVSLRVDPGKVYQQRMNDTSSGTRSRPCLSQVYLQAWMDHEEAVLQQVCKQHGIPMYVWDNRREKVNDPKYSLDHNSARTSIDDHESFESLIYGELVVPFIDRAQKASQAALKSAIREIPGADVFLLLDVDRTIWSGDTGRLFFGESASKQKDVFQRYKTYKFRAFWESAMLFACQSQYQERCDELAEKVRLYQSMASFCQSLPSNICPVLVTAGVREIWMKALKAAGLGNMPVIAGNHSGLHPYIIDPDSKGFVANELRRLHPGCHIFSFGDSEIDIPMMNASDRSLIVLDSRRNASMMKWIQKNRNHPKIFQVSPSSEFDSYHDGLRVGDLNALRDELVHDGANKTMEMARGSVSMQMLADQSRRADLSGPALQEIHRQIGHRLATTLLDKFGPLMGLIDSTKFPHVQGSHYEASIPTSGNVAIVPLMRGGEPMSRGVFEVFPGASLIHYESNQGKDAMENLASAKSIILVDSVINRGNSIRAVLQEILKGKRAIRAQVFVISGVTQLQAAMDLPREFPRVRFLTLRISRNQYTGKGGTDTGNRLFGTL